MSARSGRVLLTGATGFLGRHLLDALPMAAEPSAQPPRARKEASTTGPSKLGRKGATAKAANRGDHVALVRSLSSWAELPHTAAAQHVTPVAGSVAQLDGLASELKDGVPFGAIIHAAALVRHSRHGAQELLAANVDGTLNMVRLAAQLDCRLVFVSTSGTVGCSLDPDYTPTEEAPYCADTVANWPYYASKIEAERRARVLAQELGVDLVIIRPPMMLGPGDHRFRSTSQIVRVLRRKLPFVIDGGIHFIDIRDAAAAIVRAATVNEARPIYHLTGTSTTVKEFVGRCAAIGRVAAPTRTLPYGVAHTLASASAALGRLATGHTPSLLPDPVVIEMARHHWNLGSRFAESDLGYRSRPAEATLVDTIAWLSSNHPVLATLPGAPIDFTRQPMETPSVEILTATRQPAGSGAATPKRSPSKAPRSRSKLPAPTARRAKKHSEEAGDPR